MLFIGITGGIGAGKSEILSYISKHYVCEIYLADEVAHLVKRPGTECFEKLVDLLGTEVLAENGDIDRGRMADKIFKDEGLLIKVNDIVHPAVRKFLLDRLEVAEKSGKTELFFVEAALLIECGYGAFVDEMWYIYASEDIRRKRLSVNRGYSEDKIEGIFKSQLSEDEFRRACSFVIDNSGNLEDSYKQIDKKLEAFTWRE